MLDSITPDDLDVDPGEDVYVARGAAAQLFRCRAPEVLIEGGAGTGKSRAVMEYVNYLCEEYAGIRVLMLRGTRKSMNEAILRDFEKDVLGEGHDAVVGGASVEHRDFYDYPNNAHIALGGLDNTDRIMSTQYDVIVVFEATDREVTMEAFNKLKSRLRHNVLPWQQIVMDCNPASEFHWLNQYFPKPNEPDETDGRCVRLLSRHEDNPAVTPQYLETLSSLTGVDRDRLYLHKWVAATGQVFEEFDARTHVIDADKLPKMRFYWGAVDWGYHPAPGVFQVWGMDQDGKCYMVVEVYKTRKQLDWWAEVAEELNREFDLRRIVCDPEEPEHIDKFNDRLSSYQGRVVRRIATKAENAVRPGLDMIRWGLRPQSVPDLNEKDAREDAQLFIVRGNLRYGVDEYLKEAKKPTSTLSELPSYVYVKNEEGKPIKDEKPDPACADHGIDAMRYAMMYAWKKDRRPKKHRPMFEPGTLGHLLGHEEIMKRSRYGQ